MDNIRNQICGRIQLFAVCVTQCVCLGFDSNFLSLFLHEKLFGPLLLVGNCIFNGGILLGALVVWMNGYAKWDVWFCVFGLLSFKVITLCILAIDLMDVIFLSLVGCAGFCIGSKQSLIFDLSLRRIPNPAKKLLLPLCFTAFSFGILLSSLFFDQNTEKVDVELEISAGNFSIYHSNYKSFNILQQFQIHSRLNPSYIIVASALIQCFLGYAVYDLWKKGTADSRAQESEDNETVIRAEYTSQVEWICATLAFFSSGLIAVYHIFAFSLNEISILYFYAFLVGCLASRLLFLIFACKFPGMFWLCSSLVICGISICCFSFEEIRLFFPALYGMGLALIFPSIVTIISRQKGALIHPLIFGSITSSVVYPIMVTQVIQNYGNELFTTVNFLTLLIMVCLFVYLLNVQSITEKPQDEKHAKIWIFFQGQGLKRANSVRKFISTFRESLRGTSRSYRRLRRFQRSPQPNSNLIENPLASAPTRYRSTQSVYKSKSNFLQLTRRLYNSMDEEPASTISLSPMPSEEGTSQVSNLEED